MTRAGALPNGVMLHDASAAYNANRTLRLQDQEQSRSGLKYQRQVIEYTLMTETTDNVMVPMKAYLVLDVPITVVTKAAATAHLKELLSFFSLDPVGGNPGDYVASFINKEYP